jgi:exopolysaccharide biosynthesis polyprenyl glycosylphosphotransferase
MSVEIEYPLGESSAPAPPQLPTPAAAVARARGLSVRRQGVVQKMLGCADLLSAAVGLTTLAIAGGHGIPHVTLWTLPLIVLLAEVMGLYHHDELTLRKSTLEELPALLGIAAATAIAWSMITWAADVHVHLRGGGAGLLWFSTAVALVVTRSAARKLASFTTATERVLIVGSAASRAPLADSLETDPGARLEVVGFLPLEDERRSWEDWGGGDRRRRDRTFDDLEKVIRELEINRVFIIPTNADGELILEAVRRALRAGVNVSIVPRLFEVVGSAVAFDMVGGVTVLGVRRPGLTRGARLTKRMMDVTVSAICLLVLLPLMALVALAIKLDSAGPVFFGQRRVGRDGEVFRILKFRSMVKDAEALRASLEAQNESTGNFKLAHDPRVTRIGRLIRRTSLDELPQVINVLRGDMSLVGPRPLVLPEDRLVEGRHRDRLHLAPGITGPWQVLGPVRPPLLEMVKTDYLYAVNWSIWSDVKLLLRTLSHVAARRGL